MKKNLFEVSPKEKAKILEMHYNAAGKRFLTEEDETKEPDLSKYDWSNNGTTDFMSANNDQIINYIIARDSLKSYSKLQVYMPIMEWYKNNKKKMSDEDVKKSLYIWVSKDPWYGLRASQKIFDGDYVPVGDGAKMKEYADKWQTQVVDQLNGTSAIDGQVKAQLAMIPKMINEAINKKVYIDDRNLKALNTSLDNLIKTKGKPNTDVKKYGFLPDGGYTAQELILVTGAKVYIQNVLTGKQKGYSVNIDVSADDSSRLKILTDIQNLVNEKMQNPISRDGIRKGKAIELTIPSVVAEADYIEFIEGEATVAGQESGVGTQTTIELLRVINFSYPDENADQATRNKQADSFFGDDKTTISDEADTAMYGIANKVRQIITDLQKQYGKEKVKILNIGIGSYASTSAVNTSFGTGDAFKTQKVFNKANNNKLANARLNAMDVRFKEVLNETIGNITDQDDESITGKITTLVKQSEANKGPEWNTMGGDNYGTKYGIESYGPLYQAAYKNNNKLTPRQFYASKANNQSLKTDYEMTYAGYRKSSIGISIQLQAPEELAKQTPTGEYVMATAGDFSGEITWSRRQKIEINWPKIGKIKFGKRFPKGFMPSGGRSTDCPRW